jgi:hypothetical protein
MYCNAETVKNVETVKIVEANGLYIEKYIVMIIL